MMAPPVADPQAQSVHPLSGTAGVKRSQAAAAYSAGWFAPLNPCIASWKDQRVWVVGASSGIGRSIARQLHAQGARLALSARNADGLATALEASPRGDGAANVHLPLVLPFDIMDAEAVWHAAGTLQTAWGGIDLVMIVAGTHVEMRADGLDPRQARRLFDVNVFGPMQVVAAVSPAMVAAGAGGIVLVASVAGYIGLPKALIYGPSKAALINFAESLYGDLRPHGVGVYLVSPGFVDTPLTQRNQFKMPALLSADDAAQRTLAGVAAGDFEIHYPKRFTRWLKLLRIAPYRIQLNAVRKITGL